MKQHFTLILGTTRINNESSKVALFLKGLLEESGLLEIDYLDLGETDIPIMEERLPKLLNPSPQLLHWNEKLKSTNGILIVAPEYKNSMPGSLKNFLDYLPPQIFRRRPVGIVTVSSGVLGGINCLAQLRPVCLALGGTPIPDYLRVPFVTQMFPDDGSGPDEKFSSLAHDFLQEYLKYVGIFMSFDEG
jgi:NAD(P)H-dependent FMN reductase